MKVLNCILAAGLLVSTNGIAAPIQFEDTSDKLGFNRGSETWGIAWGSLDSDKYPDLWNSGHRLFPRMYKNTGTGDFDDVAMEYDHNQNGFWIKNTTLDIHGGSWGDYDNDGDDDLLLGDENDLFINGATTGGFFTHVDEAALQQHGIWNNTDSDRELESDRSCNIRPAGARRTGQYVLLFDIDVDGEMDQICAGEGPFPFSQSLSSSNYDIPPLGTVNDAAIGDFDNDLRTDIVISRGATRPNGASKINDNRIEGWFKGGGRGFLFTAQGEVTFMLDGNRGGTFKKADIVTLNTNGATSGSGRGFTINYDPASELWRVDHTFTTQAYIRVITENVVSEPTLIGMSGADLPQANAVGMNRASGIEWVSGVGLSKTKSCVSIVTADFDNDMDLDIYMACRTAASNLANRYFDNQGDGTFKEVLNHGGEGPVGNGIEFGVADSVITADYDLDGFMDLAVSNGLLFYPVNLGGPDTLIRNQGNNNHWIELDLIGTVSPRAAIGAKVYVTAGGKTQLREQSGGYHRWSQNHTRIHVGLAVNTVVDEIRVEWPSGEVDIFNNISADGLYDVVENGSIVLADLGQPSPASVEPNQECGEPAYNNTLGPALLVWRDCGTDNWRLRAKGGLGRLTEHRDLTLSGSIVASPGNFGSVGNVSIDAGDTIDKSDPSRIDFSLTVQQDKTNSKGFNFNSNGQSFACLDIDSTDFEVIYLGGFGKRIDLPYNLTGLGACDVDTDGDGIPDINDPDDDNDGVADQDDAFPTDPNESVDTDGDGVGDNSDAFINDPTETVDSDNDGIGDNADIDMDNDSITDSAELMPVASLDFNVVQNVSAFGNQDASKNVTISQDGSQITLRDNTWRQTSNTYTITPDTHIEFDFQSDVEGEIQGIGFSNSTALNTNDYFMLSGTQAVSIINDFQYDLRNQVQHFVINVGAYYTGSNYNLVFINDDDAGVGSDSTYSNIRIYERRRDDTDGDGVPNKLDLDSDNDGIADIVEVGLIDNIGDFKVDNLIDQGSITSPRDTDGDGIPDFLDLESNNAANDGTQYDIDTTIYTDLDTNNDGTLNTADTNGGVDANGDGVDDQVEILDGPPQLDTTIGNSTIAQNTIVDGWVSNLVINETDVYTNTTAQDELLTITTFDFAAGSNTAPITPFIVRVDGDNQFEVLAIGQTQTVYNVGRNSVDFSNSATTIQVSPGMTIAVGFLDANADGSNSNGAAIEYRTGSDEIWYSGGPLISDSASVFTNLAPNAGTNVITSLLRDYLFNVSFSISSVPPSPTGDECGEPSIDRTTEQAVFLWKDCSTGLWSLRLTGGGDPDRITADGDITSIGGFTDLSGFSIESSDVLDNTTDINKITYELKVRNTGQDGFSFTPVASDACFTLDSSVPLYLGENKVPSLAPLNLDTLDVCDLPPVVVDPPECGEPIYDRETEPGLFLWKDCDAADNVWTLRIAGGGLPFAPYIGTLDPSNPVIANGVQLEANDTLDVNVPSNSVSFILNVANKAIDGVDLVIPANSQTCFDVSQIPSGAQVYVGRNRLIRSGSFNLEDLGVCL